MEQPLTRPELPFDDVDDPESDFDLVLGFDEYPRPEPPREVGTHGRVEARYEMPPDLRHDVRHLGELLGVILREAGGQDLLEDVEQLRELAIRAYGADAAALDEAVALVASFSLERADQVARAFTAYFHLANLAEEHHRSWVLQTQEVADADEPAFKNIDFVEETIPAAFTKLSEEVGEDEALRLLQAIEFHPVLTAHPTEARRRAVSRSIRRIGALLARRDALHPTGTPLAEIERALLAEVDILWRTGPLRPAKPTPLDEVKTAVSVFDYTLFATIPDVYRRLDDWLLGSAAGTTTPLARPFMRIGSWIGADRDGNPTVTAEVTREAAKLASAHALAALEAETRSIARTLTLSADDTPPSSELLGLRTRLRQLSAQMAAEAESESVGEPYRAVLLMIAARIHATATRDADLAYRSAEKLEADLRVVQQALVDAGAPRSAYGQLQRLLWQVQTFGFHLAELEVRQHSAVHANALTELREKGPNSPDLSEMTVEVLDTFRALGAVQARFGERAARRYIVSFTQSVAHLAAVYELAEYAFADPEDRPVIDVIPLFETFADLQGAVRILDEMLTMPPVHRRLSQNGRRLEVMLGYSDSSKDVGPVAAALALDEAQSRIAAWARAHAITLTLFHGRGGALGRGGGPANRALLAQPPHTVDGRFKLTEQGEVILARYGEPAIAARHIEQVAAAMLLASAPSIEERNAAATNRFAELALALQETSREKFHSLVNAEGFAHWFSQVTPLEELGLLPIGSRPAKRGLSVNSLEDLRAIPWVFSWSQARLNLAGWFGLGTALRSFVDSRPDGLEVLQAAFRAWPLFNTLIDNVEMSLAKTDERIAARYLELGSRDDLARQVLDELRLTREMVLAVTGESWPMQRRRVLGRAIQLRGPYVDALSLLQVRALRALRTDGAAEGGPLSEEDRAAWRHLLLLTVNGVSAGVQNTG